MQQQIMKTMTSVGSRDWRELVKVTIYLISWKFFHQVFIYVFILTFLFSFSFSFCYAAEWEGGEVIGEKVWLLSFFPTKIHPSECTHLWSDTVSWTISKLQAASSWLYVVPWGIRKVLNYIAERYNNPPIYIMENGMLHATHEESWLPDGSFAKLHKQIESILVIQVWGQNSTFSGLISGLRKSFIH